MASGRPKNFISDHETAVDLLYYEAIARTVASFVREDPSTPVTVGVHGDWGAGKSSVLRMTEAALAKDERTLCLWFNGWVFEGFEDAKAVVLETIVSELKRARPKSTKVKDAAKKLFKRIQWLKLARKAGGLALTAVTGIPAPEMVGALMDKVASVIRDPAEQIGPEQLKSVVEQAGEFIKESTATEDSVPEHIHGFRKEFEELLKSADIDQLVILIDDLDRCLPETAIATLEAVRLFLFVPRTAFVVGADEAMIEYSVRRHFPELAASPGAASYARNYLEKLIQVPFRIPALGIAETRAYITLLLSQRALGEANPTFKKMLEAAREDLRRPWRSRGLDRELVRKTLENNIPPEVEQALLLSGQITHILTEGTRGNPRQIKRFLNSMALRQAIARERGFDADVKVQVLAKLMLAERFATDFYDQIGRLATASPEGKVAALARLEASVAAEKGGKGNESNMGDEGDEWLKNEWIRAWARIEPGLGDTDLRPYVFVTRDKRAYYLSAGLAGHLDALVERLMGQGLAVQGAVPEVQKLGDIDAHQVFDELRTRVLQSEKLNHEPAGVKGLIALAKAKAILQPALLQMLKHLAPEGLGAWAATSCGQAFTNPEVKEGFHQLLAAWQKSSNAALKAAATMATKVK